MNIEKKLHLLLVLFLMLSYNSNAQTELLKDGRYVGEFEVMDEWGEGIELPYTEHLCFMSDSTYELKDDFDLNTGRFIRKGDSLYFNKDEYSIYRCLIKNDSIVVELLYLHIDFDDNYFTDTIHFEFIFEEGKSCDMEVLVESMNYDDKGQDVSKSEDISPYLSSFEEDDDPWLKKQLKADLVLWGYGGGDGMRMVRNKKTKKWGIYQIGGEDIDEFIPMLYDSIRSFEQNANFTAVYNNGKMGLYLARWTYGDKAHEAVPCEYDDFEVFETLSWPSTYYLAVKKNDKWAWLDWFNNDLQCEFNFNTPDDLPPIEFEQQMYYEEE